MEERKVVPYVPRFPFPKGVNFCVNDVRIGASKLPTLEQIEKIIAIYNEWYVPNESVASMKEKECRLSVVTEEVLGRI